MKRKRGFTLIETLLVFGVVVLLVFGGVAIMGSLLRSYGRTSAQVDVDLSASQALQRMARDLQEAKRVDILSTTRLSIYFPKLNEDGTYDRSILDSDNPIYYYRGNENGTENEQGEYLIRKLPNGSWRAVCSGVIDLSFESMNSNTVAVSVKALRKDVHDSVTCEMLHRTIFLRNY